MALVWLVLLVSQLIQSPGVGLQKLFAEACTVFAKVNWVSKQEALVRPFNRQPQLMHQHVQVAGNGFEAHTQNPADRRHCDFLTNRQYGHKRGQPPHVRVSGSANRATGLRGR